MWLELEDLEPGELDVAQGTWAVYEKDVTRSPLADLKPPSSPCGEYKPTRGRDLQESLHIHGNIFLFWMHLLAKCYNIFFLLLRKLNSDEDYLPNLWPMFKEYLTKTFPWMIK